MRTSREFECLKRTTASVHSWSSTSSRAISFSFTFQLFFIFSILLLLSIPSFTDRVEGEGGDEELVIELSNTTIEVDQIIYVNITLSVENNTGNVTVVVRDSLAMPVFLESAELDEGKASILFALYDWHINGTYIVNATAHTNDNQTYNATGIVFEYVNWTAEIIDDDDDDDPIDVNGDDEEEFPFPLPPPTVLIPAGIIASMGIFGYGAEKGRYRIWLALVPLYTRLRKSEALEDFNRGQIYRTIAEHPGIRYSEIKEMVGIGNGVLSYHLKVLQSMKYVKSIGDMTYKRFYLWGAAAMLPPDLEKPFTPIQKAIVDYLHSNSWMSQSVIADSLKLKQQTVSKNLRSLEHSSIVKKVKELNVNKYNLTEGYLHWLSKQISPKCPTCMNQCRIGAKFCENCGTKLENT